MSTPDTTAPGLGLCFVPSLPPERLRAVAEAAEAAGLDELWVWEDCFKEGGIATAAAALAWTERIRVGIGLLPVPLRNVALTAMELATLHRMFPGRLIAGVGHGVQEWMGQVGARAASPMTLLREYAEALRSLLAGEEVSVQGRYVQLDAVRLDWPPTPDADQGLLWLGGSGPKSLALAAELGDGVLLGAGLSPEQVRQACEIARETADRPDPPVVAPLIAATGPGAEARVDADVQIWGGQPGSGAAVAGSAEQIAAAVQRLAGIGATSVMIQPTLDEPDLDGLIEVLGSQVRPLLGGS